MSLLDFAIPVDHAGEQIMVIEDAPLLAWARENDLPARDAQVKALESDIIPHRYLKNRNALSLSEQLRICRATAFVCGCGGLGGALLILLARAGVGSLRFVDYDIFSTTNLNRQLLSDIHQISRPKVETAIERIASINPFVQVEPRMVLLDESNAETLVRGCDIVLDALDNIAGRFALAEAARHHRVPFIHAAVAGWWGQVSTLLPGSTVGLSNIYGGRRIKEKAEEATGVLGPAAAAIASLQAFEALRILTGRKPSYADRLLYFDGESGDIAIIPLI